MKRIIVCDDEPHITEGLRHLLRAPERHVEVASSGKEVLRLVEQGAPDLLIIDIMMPEMSGLEVVANLRNSGVARHLPIIILTAKGQGQDAALAQEMWGAVVIGKPFDPATLRKLVATTLEQRACAPQPCT
jgi:DNA-binding response OmpR family regulator